MGDFRMPSLGSDLEAGTLVEWRVAVGQTVRRGDVIAVVESDKGAIEVEVWEDGVVEALLAEPPARVPAGTPLARIRGTGAPPPLPAAQGGAGAAAPAPPPAGTRVAPPDVAPAQVPTSAAGVRASPAARALARERGLDLATVRGTGPDGAITRDDVARADVPSRTPPPAPAAAVGGGDAAERAAGLRRAIAAAMARSKREIPHYYLATRIDVSKALGWLAAENARRPVEARLLPAALWIQAVARAATEIPEMNGLYVDGAFRPSEAVHVGVAVSLRQGGLVAPAIHDAARRSVDEIMRALADLIVRARSGTLRASELTDPTITLTSLGDRGVDEVFGVIHPPQVAIVGFGTASEQPWAEGGRVEVRPVVSVTLAADHRVSDGHRGGLFLAAIARRLHTPEAP